LSPQLRKWSRVNADQICRTFLSPFGMTRALPFTEHGLRRAIKAVHKSGLRVAGVRPDGTVIVCDGDNPLAPIPSVTQDAEALQRWGDDQA